MRMHIRLVMTLGIPLLVTGAAEARPKKKTAAPSESAEARAARLASPDDTGTLRMAGPARLELAGASVQVSGDAAEHKATANEELPVRAPGPLSGALEELVARQMRTNEAAFASCAADAAIRGAVRGDRIGLIIQATGRHAEARLVDATQVDSFTAACFRSAARGLRVSLPNFAYAWEVAVPRVTAAR
jgi:hypothetical protein